MYKMRGLQAPKEVGGGWENCPILSSQGSNQKGGAGLTSGLWQLFPRALPATASPLTVQDIPQPSGQGTLTKGLQGAELGKSHGSVRDQGKEQYQPTHATDLLHQLQQMKSDCIPQRPLTKGKH